MHNAFMSTFAYALAMNNRQKDLQFVSALCELTGKTPSGLAESAGLSASTLNRFVGKNSSVQELASSTKDAISQAAGFESYEDYITKSNQKNGVVVPIIGTIGPLGVVTIFPPFRTLFDPAIAAKENKGSSYRSGRVVDAAKTKTAPVLPGLEDLARESLQVDGDDNHPYYRDGDIVYLESRKKGKPDGFVGEECLVQIQDGPIVICSDLIKAEYGKYTLIQYNSPPRKNVELDWAAPVYGKYRPPK